MSFGSYDPTKKTNAQNRPARFYLKDGSNLYRVLPPAKSLATKNKIAQFWGVLWLTDSNGKKRPVASILHKKGKEIIQHDPLVTKYEEMEKQLKTAQEQGANDATIMVLKENLKRIMYKKVYALNVIDAAGTVGVLEIPYTSYQALDQRITELNAQGIDAIGIGPDKGVMFDFKKKKDERGRTVYPVDPAIRTSKGPNGFEMSYVRMPLSPEEAAVISERVSDLGSLYPTLTLEQQTALATLDQRVFDAVFARPVDADGDHDVTDESVQESFGAQAVPVSAQQPTQAAVGYSMPTPQPTVNTNNSFVGGSVVNNAQVKNFLFPDNKK